jgi:phosphoglycerol transferase MdoB-like AlkP superfamily enzyme
MMLILCNALALILLTELASSFARPMGCSGWRPVRSLRAWPFRILPVLGVFGAVLLLTGWPTTATAAVATMLFVLVAGSNVKHRVLGEPLLFTDFAILGEMARHPGFYLGAIPRVAVVALALLLTGLVVLLLWGARWSPWPRLIGVSMALLAWAALPCLARSRPWRRLMLVPDTDADLARHGLPATLSLYWLRWTRQAALPPAAPADPAPSDAVFVIVVQSESFADPERLWPGSSRCPPLPGLARARARALRWGTLSAGGFGAYTMRTEFGILFGQDEADLGFQRFDPYLTADRYLACALPRRLLPRIRRAVFVHPHDLSFYRRDRLMPAAGFDRLIGHDAFADADLRGPHVSDAALGDHLAGLIASATEPTFIYAVTIENHGPWRTGRLSPGQDGLGAYLDHLAAGDALLDRLIDLLDADGRPAVLAFFGDHRPSIPGWSLPGQASDTPYVLLRFGSDAARAELPQALTPAQLHRAILAAVRTSRAHPP